MCEPYLGTYYGDRFSDVAAHEHMYAGDEDISLSSWPGLMGYFFYHGCMGAS